MLADFLSKPLQGRKFVNFRAELMNIPIKDGTSLRVRGEPVKVNRPLSKYEQNKQAIPAILRQ